MNYAIILAGGVGSRFWPLSRKALPKQFLRIVGKDTFFEATIRRLRKIIPSNSIFIVTNRNYLPEIKRQIRVFKVPQKNIILEPKPLNTLPAIGLCAQLINLKDNQANLLVLPSDHYIKNSAGFRKTISGALKLSAEGFMALVGIKPDSPCLGYGYIKIGKKIGKNGFRVEFFQEKPNLNTAKRFFKESNIFWNSGIFCFKTEVVLNEIKTYIPRLYSQLVRIRKKQDIPRAWLRIKPISIDYGLLEKSHNLVMAKAEFFWRDLGSWDALCSVLPKDKKNNVALSNCISLNNKGIFTRSYGSKRLIAAIGLRDIIIVDTPDALLVCKKESSQDIKFLVELLKRKRKPCV